jgi:tRNA G18 (ribose-2'-O)-methylase SpoU
MSTLQFDKQEFPKEFVRSALKDIRSPFEIAVCGVGNHFNMATIIRTAHNFLCKKIYIIDGEGFYEKGTMGNHRFEDIVELPLNVFTEIVTLEKRNLVVFEKRPGFKTKDIRLLEYPENPILIFGSEKSGVPDILIEYGGGWSNTVSIPGYGVNNDLNVGVAASIAMFDWVSKHNKIH